MLRLTLGGPEIDGFCSFWVDDHVKIVFPRPDGTRDDPVPNDHLMLDWPRPLPPTRKYTVRRYDPEAGEVDLDVVLHQGGLASEWARSVPVGEQVTIAGPPGAEVVPDGYEHHVLAVDSTGLPAAARWVEEAGDAFSATVVVEVEDGRQADYPLAERPGVEVTWLRRDRGERLAQHVSRLAVPAGRTFLFAAGEATDVRPLRAWGREHCADQVVTGYWRRGVVDHDDHH